MNRKASMDYENDPAPVPGDVRDNAEAWMAAHPDVVAMFERFALDLATRGRRFGINLLRERVRWECAYEYGREPFKFCNSFSPYVARRLV
ncbi:MAG TPA: hypothetical protein VD838_08705, partial [Anaeromyxobacteraceae bacterium]|nr:hypothetical protein [Anaeromyxobacteraceae bacterium]